ncbi:hypothetical protein P775_02005 [Puniceibacterium antarcticum]|uniref:Uncharacterized protein n=2 Tax=Puniceibacterium antarcticum TaxID=1206336 RepID=A0A2G8RK37_9RHOB|nr:hypothetical protein P775_02005 [Puniceibacterium antarcticum]
MTQTNPSPDQAQMNMEDFKQAELHAFRVRSCQIVLAGKAYSSENSPVRSIKAGRRRAVSCVSGNFVYQIKSNALQLGPECTSPLEELSLPADCRSSGFTPRLFIFDKVPRHSAFGDTHSWALSMLTKNYLAQGGDVFIGEDCCWDHLEEKASASMRLVINKIARGPDALWRGL